MMKSNFKNLGLWLAFFVPALIIELLCYIAAPFVALFPTMSYETDVVKRVGKATVSLWRDNLIKPLRWFQTHDNNVDEWWYGMYNVDHWFAFARNWHQGDYDTKAWVRYYCRVMWLWRNCAYGFHYHLFSRPKETVANVYVHGDEDGRGFWYQLQLFSRSFQLEAHIPRIFIQVGANITCVGLYAFDQYYLMLVAASVSIWAFAALVNRYVSINIGWKAHKTTERLLYANRIISLRSYE